MSPSWLDFTHGPVLRLPDDIAKDFASKWVGMVTYLNDMNQPGYYSGHGWGEEITWNRDNNFDYSDVVYGRGGLDKIQTGGGNDKIVEGSNAGTWNGSGDGAKTVIEPGTGDDLVDIPSGATGSFFIQEEQIAGGGSDRFQIGGGDYVKISDNSDERDFFVFENSFRGHADITSFDKGIDKLELFGNWQLDRGLSSNSETVFTRDVDDDGHNDATVTVGGIAGNGYNPEYELRILDAGRSAIPGFETGNTHDVLFI